MILGEAARSVCVESLLNGIQQSLCDPGDGKTLNPAQQVLGTMSLARSRGKGCFGHGSLSSSGSEARIPPPSPR